MDTCGSFNSHVMTFSGSQCLEQESWRCYLGLTGRSGDSDWGHCAPKASEEDLLHVYSGDGCNEPLLCHRLLVRGLHRLLRPRYPPRVPPNMPAASSEQVRVKGSHQEGKICPHVTSSGEAPLTLCPVSHESRELHKVVVLIHPWPSTSHDTASAHKPSIHKFKLLCGSFKPCKRGCCEFMMSPSLSHSGVCCSRCPIYIFKETR